MAAQVGWSTASVFIALAAAHAGEEIAAELRSVKEAVSLARLRRLIGERLAPLLLVAALAVSGVLIDDFWLWLALGVLAALAFATGRTAGMIAGALLLQIAFTADCVDGQLARYTRRFSKLGAWLDSVFDRGKEYVVYAGLAGTDSQQDNLAPTAVYVGFWVGVPFLSLLVGDWFRLFNPWRAIGRATGWAAGRLSRGEPTEVFPYPERLPPWAPGPPRRDGR